MVPGTAGALAGMLCFSPLATFPTEPMVARVNEVLVLGAAVVPVVVLLALGRVLARIGLLSVAGVGDLNRLVYWAALPAQLVVVVARSDLRQSFDLAAGAACVLGFIVALVLTLVVSVRRSAAERGSLASGVGRANAAFIGLPVIALAAPILGDERGAALTAGYSVLLALMVPVFNVGSVLGFILPQHGLAGGGWRRSLRELPRNPLILACILGIVLSLVAPDCLDGNVVGDALDLLARASLPLALLVTGAALDVRRVRAAPGLLVVAALGKLVLVPALTAGLAWVFGATATGLAAATILMACPAAVANTPMARQLGGDEALMAAQVVVTTIIAPLTLIAWLVVVV